jgi:anti-sigma regulatory factor (Ser/Thr protein kinase)
LLSASAGHYPVIAANLELLLAPTPAAPAEARAAVSAWLGEQRSAELLMEVAPLLVSELVTNSIRHASIATGEHLRLNGQMDKAILRLEMWDGGTGGTVARRARERGDEVGGFGLELVARLSSAWGVERNGVGTTVWLELPTAVAGRRG